MATRLLSTARFDRASGRAAWLGGLSLLLLSVATAPALKRWLSGDAGRTAGAWLGQEDEFARRVRQGKMPRVVHHRFHSHVLQREVGVVVVTPPGYEARPDQRHPVVYVYPGIGGDEWSYLREVGVDGPAMKALFSQPESAPLVVSCHPGDKGPSAESLRVLGQELVSFVDHHYRTHARLSGRSLQGFSLGGVTALTLLTRWPGVFGSAAAFSSACYLLPNCSALREHLRSARGSLRAGQVLLAVGARENQENRIVNEELAPLFGVPLVVLPGVDHDLAAQLSTRFGDQEFGEYVAEFHFREFAR